MTEIKKTFIPQRLKNASKDHPYVAGSIDIVDDVDGRNQQDINADTYRKNETYSKGQLNSMITTPEQQYVNLAAEDGDTLADIFDGVTGEADKTYRVGCWDGTEYNTGKFAEYSWDGTDFLLLNVQTPGIDAEPTVNSTKLVESGGVYPLKLNMSELKLMTQHDTMTGGFVGLDGYASNQNYQSWIFPVTEGNYYTFTDSVNAGSNLYLVVWLSAYDLSGTTPSFTIVAHESYQGSLTENVSFVDQPIKAPTGALYVAINLYNTHADYETTNVKRVDGFIRNDDLKKEIQQDSVYVSEVNAIAENSVAENKYLSPSGELVSDTTFDVYYYNVTGGENYVISGFMPYINGGLYILTWLDSSNNVIDTLYRAYYSTQIDASVENQLVVAPSNATKAALNIKRSYSSLFKFGVLGNPISLEQVRNAVIGKADIAAISQKVKVDVAETIDNYFFKPNGLCVGHSSFEIAMYELESGGSYSFSGSYSKRTTVPFIAWLNSNGEFVEGALTGYLYAEPYKGSMDDDVNIYMQDVTPPSGAAYAIINVQKDRRGKFALYKTGNVIDIDALNKKVNILNNGNMEVTLSGDPKTIESQIIIRTSFDSTRDLVVVYYRYLNDDITPHESYLGNKNLQTSAIMTTSNRFHFWYDSTAPLRNGIYAPWHMFAQHGYEMPVVTCTHSLTASDVGSTWVDNADREFTLGKIDGNNLYLLPKVMESSIPGVYTRSWLNHVVESAISTITNDGTTLNVSSQTAVQLRPIQDSKELRIFVDGTEVTEEGVYMCNDLVISETLECFNPFTVETWFPTPVKNTIAMELIQSFNIHGLSHRYDAIINVKEPLKFQEYAPNQGQCLVNDGFSNVGSIADGYSSYVMVPKVKKTVNGNRADIPHVTSSNSDDIMAYRNTTDLYDVDDMPDREITYLYDGEKYLAGFAAGISLTKGLSVKDKRKLYIPNNARTINMSYDNRNKFYVNAIVGSHFENSVIPAGFTASFSTYWSYFDPSANKGQVYWYKDGNGYVIYAHYQDANANLAINLPAEMDGLQVEVLEKTDGVTLLTDNIVNGKVYVTTDSTDNNYIVLKTK